MFKSSFSLKNFKKFFSENLSNTDKLNPEKSNVYLISPPAHYHVRMERTARIELAFPEWKSGVLPLNHARIFIS